MGNMVQRASSDVGFMLIAYNLRRIANILSPEVLKEYLRILLTSLLRKSNLTWLKNNPCEASFLPTVSWYDNIQWSLVKA